MASHSLADVTAALLAELRPAALIAPAPEAALLATLAWFPRELSRIFGFECRLDDDAQTDAFLRVETHYKGRAVLAGSGEVELSPALRADPAWRRVRRFAHGWLAARAPWDVVDQIWLELDIPGVGAAPPSPGLLFWHAPIDHVGSRADAVAGHVALAQAGVAGLTGAPLEPAAASTLARCVEALPPGAEVFSTGVMLSRTGRHLRLCTKGLPAGSHLAYLEHAGLPDARALAPLFDDLVAVGGAIQVGLDVGPALGPRVHLELRAGDRPTPGFWTDLGRWLVERGLARADKLDAFARWAGEPLVIRLRDEPRRRLFERRLSHVKVALVPGARPVAKAYFGAWESYDRWDELQDR